MKKNTFLIALSIILFSPILHAGLLFNYSQLTLKDLDQMNQLVSDKLKESRKSTDGKTVPLKEALQAVFSRPDRDGIIDKVVGPLRTSLDAEDAWEDVLTKLTAEAINALKNPKAFKPVVQVTYHIFLENLLAEMKPYLGSEGFEKSIASQIRDAKIVVSKEAMSERKVRTMQESISPSELADKLLQTPTPAK